VIAPSFGDIHSANQLQNGMLPLVMADGICAALREQLHNEPGASLTIDLEAQTVTGPDGASYRFEIGPNVKERLLKGLDETGLTMNNVAEIERFEERHYRDQPWLA
jgi:3-isopropylmalate/(R)-2-methylmalate dehydratase small subunit